MTTGQELDAVSPPSTKAGWLARAVAGSDVLWVVPLTLAGALLAGAVEAAFDAAVHGARAHIDAAVLAGALGLLLGALGALAVAVLRRLGPVLRVASWLRRATSRDRAANRQPVLRLHALVIAGLIPLAGWVIIARPLFAALLALQEQGLAVALAVIASSSVMALGAVVFACARWLERPLAWIDRRWALPLPPPAGVRYFLYVAAPASAFLITFAHAYGDLLGLPGKLLAVPLVLVGTGLVAHVWGRVRPRSQRLRRAAGVALIAGWSVAVLVAAPHGGQAAADRSSSPTAALGALLSRPVAIRRAGTGTYEQGADLPPVGAPNASTFFGVSEGDSRKYNVVWVIVDALRADEVGKLSAGKSITPNLDRLAAESVVFERAYSQASSTSYSIPSMLTGRNVDAVQWGWDKSRPQLPEEEITMAERLGKHGYDTVLITTQFIRGRLKGLQQGYRKTISAAGPTKTRRLWDPRTSPLATARAISTVGELAPGPRPRRPFFLTVYYGDPHAPYVNHEEFGDRFPKTERGNYEADVAFADLHLGQLLDHLRIRSPLWERTIVIVTADHGEAFSEHGHKRHGGNCHVESVHVPLMLRVPGMAASKIATPVALVDIVPTLIELLGAPRDGADELGGTSLLVPILAPSRVDPQRAIFSTAAHQREDQRQFLQRTLRQGGYALFHWRAGDRWALFHTDEDPLERHDLIDDPARAQRVRRMQQLLASSLTGNVGQPPKP